MSRNSYDDWNYTNESRDSSENFQFSRDVSSKSSLIFLFCSACLVIINLVNVYSAGFEVAQQSGREQWYYLFRQLVFVGAGLVLAFIISKLPSELMKILSALMILVCVILLCLNVKAKPEYLHSGFFRHLVFGSTVFYWSSFISNRNNRIDSLSQMYVPTGLTVVLMVLVAINFGYSFAFYYLIMVAAFLLFFRVKLYIVILMILYSMIPLSVYILTDAQRVESFLRLLIPGLYSKSEVNSVITLKSAITSGSLFGKGLGNGEYKLFIGKELLGKFSFCNFAEELGFAGVSCLFVLLSAWFFCAIRNSMFNTSADLFFSDCALGFSLMTFYAAIINLVSILGLIPFDAFDFPFLSSGTEIILILAETGIVYRSIEKSGFAGKKEVTSKEIVYENQNN